MFKEEFPGIGANEFAKRGMAILTLDGPGQGETRIKGVTVTDEKYMRAGKAALDFLERRPEIDRTRLAVSGASFGSYWAPHLAARDPRVKACAGIMGILYSMKAIFELAPPSFKLNYMFMAGIEDETEFDRVAATMGMQGLGQRINCPVLITQGEDDILCPVEGAEKFFAELAGPKEMWIFQNEHHALGGVIALVIPWLIDWLADAMNGQLPANHARRRDFTPI
jgi:dipeptidyl aminopeptidase/acylaminoacyl peptidase